MSTFREGYYLQTKAGEKPEICPLTRSAIPNPERRYALLIADGYTLQQVADVERHAERIATLEAALERYGRHDESCEIDDFFGPPLPCTCGLSAILASAGGGDKP